MFDYIIVALMDTVKGSLILAVPSMPNQLGIYPFVGIYMRGNYVGISFLRESSSSIYRTTGYGSSMSCISIV